MKHQHVVTIPGAALTGCAEAHGQVQLLVREFRDGQAAEVEVRMDAASHGRWVPVELVGGTWRKEVPARSPGVELADPKYSDPRCGEAWLEGYAFALAGISSNDPGVIADLPSRIGRPTNEETHGKEAA